MFLLLLTVIVGNKIMMGMIMAKIFNVNDDSESFVLYYLKVLFSCCC